MERIIVCRNPYSVAHKAKRLGIDAVCLPFVSAVGVRSERAARLLSCYGSAQTLSRVFTCDDGAEQTDRTEVPLTHLHLNKIDGRGIGCALIDTGCAPHLDFCLPFYRLVFAEAHEDGVRLCLPYDDNGHGTHVAGIMCGNGFSSGGKVTGAAPKSDLIAVKAVESSGEGSALKILIAMQWIYDNRKKYNIRVLNLSLGAEPQKGNDPLRLGAEALHRAGITVIASAGNSGPSKSTVKSPGISPKIITVGGATQSDNGWFAAPFSSRGAVKSKKPDLIAPAIDIYSADPDGGYKPISGTSMAAPYVAGYCALILQAHPLYSPDKIKELLLSRAAPLVCDRETCGKGLFKPFDPTEE